MTSPASSHRRPSRLDLQPGPRPRCAQLIQRVSLPVQACHGRERSFRALWSTGCSRTLRLSSEQQHLSSPGRSSWTSCDGTLSASLRTARPIRTWLQPCRRRLIALPLCKRCAAAATTRSKLCSSAALSGTYEVDGTRAGRRKCERRKKVEPASFVGGKPLQPRNGGGSQSPARS